MTDDQTTIAHNMINAATGDVTPIQLKPREGLTVADVEGRATALICCLSDSQVARDLSGLHRPEKWPEQRRMPPSALIRWGTAGMRRYR